MTWNDFIHWEIGSVGKYDIIMWRVLLAISIILGMWMTVIVMRKMILKPRFLIDRIDSKRRMSVFIISKYVGWVISFFLILKALNFDIKPLLFGSTALLVGLGFGLQHIFRDFISGLFLLFEGSIKIGDIIEVDSVVGKVNEVNLRSSEIVTRDNVTIFIPNSKFVSDRVVNWSHDGDSVRFEINVSVAYGSDVEKVFECLEGTMSDNSHVQKSPKPFVRFTNFGESALEFQMIFWSRETFVIENIKSDLRREVYKRLAANGLSIPFPQRDIHIKGMENIVKPTEKQNN